MKSDPLNTPIHKTRLRVTGWRLGRYYIIFNPWWWMIGAVAFALGSLLIALAKDVENTIRGIKK